MRIGVPKEVKTLEYRVGLTPDCVRLLIVEGHEVWIQENLGVAIGFSNESYERAGAKIVGTAEEVYSSELVVKVKEPIEEEYKYLRDGLILFCYLHLAPNPKLTNALIESKTIAIAYETVTDRHGQLPLLTPMSEIAGRVSIQEGAHTLQMGSGGKGLLLGGVPGVLPAKVTVIGAGVVGTEAARMALGLGADVTILDTNVRRLKEIDTLFSHRLKTLVSTSVSIAKQIKESDLVVGSVLIPGKRAPKLITEQMIASMARGSVFVDVAIDQGGCSETSKPTTHTDPTYQVNGVVHYCVTNIPSACSRTASEALTNVTLSYVRAIASKGYVKALEQDLGLLEGLNTCSGKVTSEPVATDLGYTFHSPEKVL